MSLKKPLQAVRRDYHAELMKEWALAFTERHLDELRVYRSLPQEDARLVVPRVHLEAHIALMRTHVAGKFAELVFSLDEVGPSDWSDRRPREVMISM
jgi:hypothetical protein